MVKTLSEDPDLEDCSDVKINSKLGRSREMEKENIPSRRRGFSMTEIEEDFIMVTVSLS